MKFDQLLNIRMIVGLCASCKHWEKDNRQEEEGIAASAYCQKGSLDYPSATDSCIEWEEVEK